MRYESANAVQKSLVGAVDWYATPKSHNTNGTTHTFKTEILGEKDGFRIIDYSDMLHNGMIPAVEKLLKDVRKTVVEIGISDALRINGKEITETNTYKKLGKFYSGKLSPSGLTEEYIKELSIDEGTLVSEYNMRQKSLNKKSENSAKSYSSADYNYGHSDAHLPGSSSGSVSSTKESTFNPKYFF